MGSLVPIVEGFSELDGVPALLRRITYEAEVWDLPIAKPFRVKRQLVVRDGELERAIAFAVRDREDPEAVIVILDADDDCPATLGPLLFERARAATALPVVLILATREFEGWFLAAKESLRGRCNIRDDAERPADPESIRDAKGHLTQNMEEGSRYVEVQHQAALADAMDMQEARENCDSFDKFMRDLSSLLSTLRPLADVVG